MRKIIELDEFFATGEDTVQPVLRWANGRACIDGVKTASEASEYVKTVEPKAGQTILLVLALGAYERYSLNRNGDGFLAAPYKVGVKPPCGTYSAPDGWISEEETLLHHYKSFETGKVYQHHQNKDPDKSIGDILKAFYNTYMQRVELLIGIRNENAPELVERIQNGLYPAVSMGCKIQWDTCSLCGNRAPTRKQYCDHLKYHMREVAANGVHIGALNPSPKFFDLSTVIRPADQTGFAMLKVAEQVYEIRSSAKLGEYLDRTDEKRAAIQKISDMDKIVRGLPVDFRTSPLTEAEGQAIKRYSDNVRPALSKMPDLDPTTITNLSQHPVAEILSTLSAAGIILTTPEFIKLLVEKLSPGAVIDEATLDAAVALQGQVFDLYAQNPQMLDQVLSTGLLDIKPENVKPEIALKAEKYLEKRSHISDYLSRTLVPANMRAEEPPWTDTLHVRDPSTGEQYVTTRGAARAAHDEIAKKQLAKTVGGAALLGGAYKLVAAGLPPAFRPLAAGTAMLAGYRHLKPDMGPQYRSEEGIDVPTLTEMSPEKTGSVAMPILGSAALVEALGHDYESRLRRGEPVGDPNAPIHNRLIDHLSQLAAEHPALSMLGTLSAYGIGKGALGKFAAYMSDLLDAPIDAVVLPSVDMDKAATKLGHVVVFP